MDKKSFLLILPRLTALTYFCVLIPWIFLAEGGIGITFTTMFGWHALMMSIAVFTIQEAILSPNWSFWKLFNISRILHIFSNRYAHIAMHILALICIGGGIAAIIQYKALSPEPVVYPFYVMYSPHSWLAIAFLGLVGIQLCVGIAVHGFGLSTGRNFHKFLGLSVLVTGLATCAMGLQDMQSSDLAGSVPPGVDTSNFTESQLDNMGYYPDSFLAQLSSGAVLVLLLNGLATAYCFMEDNIDRNYNNS